MADAVSNIGGLIYQELMERGMTGKRFNDFKGTFWRFYHSLNLCYVIYNASNDRQAAHVLLQENFAPHNFLTCSIFSNTSEKKALCCLCRKVTLNTD